MVEGFASEKEKLRVLNKKNPFTLAVKMTLYIPATGPPIREFRDNSSVPSHASSE